MSASQNSAPQKMRPALTAFVALAILAACEPAQESAADSAAEPAPATEQPDLAPATEWVVDAEGMGRVRAGMSIAELSRELGAEVRPVYDFNPTCTHITPATLPRATRLMILSDTVARVEVDSTNVRTAEGAGVGDLEVDVLELYKGQVEVQPHKYTGPTGHYLVVTPPGDTLNRIIFETDGERVVRYRAGRLPGVRFVEGCA